MLKSRTMWPPGGWQFFEPATGWRAPKGQNWNQTVAAIIKHRQANLQHKLETDRTTVEDQLDAFTCARLKNDPAWCRPASPPNFRGPLPVPSHPVRAEAGNVADAVRFLANTTAGIKLWMDWFGDGRPVGSPLAERRAAICAICPENKRGNLMDWFTGLAAKEIMAIFSALNDLNLHTVKDAELNVCKVCRCPLKAKVWVPIGLVTKHMVKETLESLPKNCWILNETEPC